jgi:hypothetical protein
MPPRPVVIDESSTPPATVGAVAAANRSVLLLMHLADGALLGAVSIPPPLVRRVGSAGEHDPVSTDRAPSSDTVPE